MGWGRQRKEPKPSARQMLDDMHRLHLHFQSKRLPRHAELFSLKRNVSVSRPKTATEFEIQANLWLGLGKLGYKVHGQLQVSFGTLKARMIVDLAVYKGDELVALIETKKDRTWEISCTDAEFRVQDQVCKYAMVHRTYLICGMQEARDFLQVVEAVGHMPDVIELRFHRCAVDHVTVMSDHRFEWDGIEIFRPSPKRVEAGSVQTQGCRHPVTEVGRQGQEAHAVDQP